MTGVFDVARKDFEDAIRSRALWVATAAFVALLGLSVSVAAVAFDEPTPDLLVTFTQGPATDFLVPLVAVMVGYRAIVGERERGGTAFLLSLPLSRSEVLLGKFLGRSAVLAVAIAAGFVVVTGLVTALYGLPSLGNVLAFGLLTVLVGATVTAIAVGVSATVSTGTRAISILAGGYVVATTLWARVPSGVHYLLVGEFPGETPPWWVQLATQLNPLEAYETGAILVLPETPHVHLAVEGSSVTAEQTGVVAVPESAYGFYDGWFVLVVLVAWIVVPLAVGYLRFRAADLA